MNSNIQDSIRFAMEMKPITFGYGKYTVFSSTKLYDIFQQYQAIQK